MALTERLSILIETVGANATVADFNKVGNAAKGIAGQAKAGKLSLDGLAQSAGMSAGALKAGLVGAAAAAASGLVTLGSKGVEAFTGLAEQIMAVQRVSGASAEDASRLVAVADDLGVSVDSVATAVFALGKNADKLPGLGVALAQDAQGATSLTGTLVNVADAYAATADPAQRAQLVTSAFGRAGKDLIPILERGGQGIRDMYAAADEGGLIMNQADLDTARTFSLVMDQLSDTVQGGMVTIGRELVPVLVDLAVVTDKATAAVNDFDQAWLGKGVKLMFQFGTVAGLASTALDLLAGAEGDARESAAKADAEWKEQQETLDELSKGTLAATSAQRGYEASARAVATAEEHLADARKDYNKLLKEGAVDEEKVADAIRSRDEALRSLAGAQRSQRKAQDEYNEALAYFNAVGGDTAADKLADARDNLADADDSVASAADRAKESADDLAKAQAGDPEFNDKLADAKTKLGTAEQGVADAKYNHARNAYDLNNALDAQNGLLATNARAVETLRGQWSQLLALHPEVAAFLGGPLAALGPAPPPPGGLTGIPAGGGIPDDAWRPAANQTPTSQTTNQTINVSVSSPQNASPSGLAKAIAWEIR